MRQTHLRAMIYRKQLCPGWHTCCSINRVIPRRSNTLRQLLTQTDQRLLYQCITWWKQSMAPVNAVNKLVYHRDWQIYFCKCIRYLVINDWYMNDVYNKPRDSILRCIDWWMGMCPLRWMGMCPLTFHQLNYYISIIIMLVTLPPL